MVKYEETNSTITNQNLGLVATAISLVSKAPYSYIMGILGYILGTNSSATVYYKLQHYAIFDGTADKFVVTKFYSDSAMNNLVDKTVYWEA